MWGKTVCVRCHGQPVKIVASQRVRPPTTQERCLHDQRSHGGGPHRRCVTSRRLTASPYFFLDFPGFFANSANAKLGAGAGMSVRPCR